MTKGKRKNVYGRDKMRCVKCGATEDLTLDHIVPRSKGGTSKCFNLQTMCLACNREKGTEIAAYVNFRRTKNYVSQFNGR